MLKLRDSTIRSQLVLLALAFVIPVSIAASGLVLYNYYQHREQLVNEALSTTRTLVFAVDREIAAQQAALSVLATSPYLRTRNLAAFYDQAKETLGHYNATNVVLVDRTYQQRINTLVPFGAPLPLDKDHKGVLRTFETGRPVVSDVFIGSVANRPLIAILVPVFVDKKIDYALGTGVWPEQIVNLLLQQSLPPDWIGVIFDSSGTIVARTHEMERFVGQKGSAALIERMREINEGTIESTTVEGIPVISTFTGSSVSSWGAAVGIPVASLTAQLRRAITWLITGITVLFLTSLVIVLAIAYRLTSSVRALKEPALALGRGDYVSVPDLGLKEANEVGEALMRASELLSTTKHNATHDSLTGLGNRVLFNEILHQRVAECERTKETLAVLYLDLDNFKLINDKYGHIIGDQVLCMLAAKLREVIRGSDVAARLGGDEFAILLNDTGADGASVVARKLLDCVSKPDVTAQTPLALNLSIGISVYPASGNSGEALIRYADEAMYRAKTMGKGRFVIAERPDDSIKNMVRDGHS